MTVFSILAFRNEKSIIYPKMNKIINDNYSIRNELKTDLINTFLKTC